MLHERPLISNPPCADVPEEEHKSYAKHLDYETKVIGTILSMLAKDLRKE